MQEWHIFIKLHNILAIFCACRVRVLLRILEKKHKQSLWAYLGFRFYIELSIYMYQWGGGGGGGVDHFGIWDPFWGSFTRHL